MRDAGLGEHCNQAGSFYISSSGLLIAIDGLVASEDHLLLTITNNVAGITKPLLHARQIALRILFALATQKDAAILFNQISQASEATADRRDVQSRMRSTPGPRWETRVKNTYQCHHSQVRGKDA